MAVGVSDMIRTAAEITGENGGNLCITAWNCRGLSSALPYVKSIMDGSKMFSYSLSICYDL